MDPIWTRVLDAAAPATRAVLEPAVERITRELAAAWTRWPDATVSEAAFVAVLAERVAAHKEPGRAVARLRVDDLLLAQWCATGDPRAIAAFERAHHEDLAAVLARFRRLALGEDELRQVLRIKLFVANERGRPAIGEYSGFGFLQNWLRVTALRALVDLARSERAHRCEDLLGNDDLLAAVSPGPDLGGRYSRAELSHAIKQAFAGAVAQLAPRERNYLRHAHVSQLTLDQIAALYGVHRATVARVLASARAGLIATTRRGLVEQLRLTEAELDSIVRAADSRIDLSLSRVLAVAEATDENG